VHSPFQQWIRPQWVKGLVVWVVVAEDFSVSRRTRTHGQGVHEASVETDSQVGGCPRVAPTRVYVDARFENKPIRCLLDSGCDRSVIGKQFVQSVKLNPPEYELFAASKTQLPVDGDTSICFIIDGRLLTTNVSVSPAVDELLLGSDWLVENGCKWDFAAGTVHIGDQLIKTHQKKNVNTCRRVFVS